MIPWKEIDAIDAEYNLGRSRGQSTGWYIILALHNGAEYADQIGFWLTRSTMTWNDKVKLSAQIYADNYRTTPSLLLTWMQDYHRRYGRAA